jgi:hypothetical protein
MVNVDPVLGLQLALQMGHQGLNLLPEIPGIKAFLDQFPWRKRQEQKTAEGQGRNVEPSPPEEGENGRSPGGGRQKEQGRAEEHEAAAAVMAHKRVAVQGRGSQG